MIRAPRQPKPGLLATHLTNKGYPYVTLYRGGKKLGERWRVCVHQLVCAAFNGPPPSKKHEVAHADGVRDNSRAENLRWVTRAENMEDARLHGTLLIGERQNGAKLTADNVREIRHRIAAGEREKDVAPDFGISPGNVNHIIRGETWPHVDGPLTIRGRGKRNGHTLDRETIDLEALRPHLPTQALEQAVRSFIRAGGRKLEGVRIFENTGTTVR